MTAAAAELYREKKVPASISDHRENVFYFEYSQEILIIKSIYECHMLILTCSLCIFSIFLM